MSSNNVILIVGLAGVGYYLYTRKQEADATLPSGLPQQEGTVMAHDIPRPHLMPPMSPPVPPFLSGIQNHHRFGLLDQVQAINPRPPRPAHYPIGNPFSMITGFTI